MRLVAAVLLLSGCASSPALGPAVDSSRISLGEASRWSHSRAMAADLNGDGSQEQIVLASDVTLNSAGRPIWEDGHRWAVILEDRGRSTLLYGAFVPNGHVEMAVVERGVLVIERTPHQFRLFVVGYDAPGKTRTVAADTYAVDRWAPSLHQ